MENLKIHQVPIGGLMSATYNPRTWSKGAIKSLTESIERFGLVDPILVNSALNRKNIVIGGHFRLSVAKKLKYKTVPVVFINIPDEDKEKELNLRLNKNLGEWDFDMLKEWDVDMLLDVGFEARDFDQILGDIAETFDDIGDIQRIKPSTDIEVKHGDLYQLGEHRLFCGDSTERSEVKKLFESNEASTMIYCDPPYNINLSYNHGIGTKGKYGGTKVKDNKSAVEYEEFLIKTIEVALSCSNKDCHVFYWCDEKYIGLLQRIYPNLGIKNERVCLWVKNNHMATPQIAFHKVYEPCVYGTIGEPYLSPTHTKANEVLNKEIDGGNRLQDDILDLFNIWLAKRLAFNEYEHPTSKPPTLHEKALRRCTKVGDIVLDLFGGSGSTLIACEQLNRKCYTVEIDPVFCYLIIQRYENLTGKKAQKIN